MKRKFFLQYGRIAFYSPLKVMICSQISMKSTGSVFTRGYTSIPSWLKTVTGYNVQKIRQIGDPVLRDKSKPVKPEFIFSQEFANLVETMIEAMRANKGVGIAAPQIGVNLRIIAVEFTGHHLKQNLKKFGVKGIQKMQMQLFPLTVVVNPEMNIVDPTAVAFKEGCLSIKGFSAVVPRMKEVQISGLSNKGESRRFTVSGWIARIFQHELEHLDGHLYIDSMQYKSLINESWKDHIS